MRRRGVIASSQPAATSVPTAAPTPPVELHPWTLEFDDAAAEAQFSADRFVESFAPFVLFLGGSALVESLSALVEPRFADAFAVGAATSLVLLVSRIWTHRLQDQPRARLLFGRVWVSTTTTAWLGVVSWLHLSLIHI